MSVVPMKLVPLTSEGERFIAPPDENASDATVSRLFTQLETELSDVINDVSLKKCNYLLAR